MPVCAAINVRKEDVDVALGDKGTVGKSGKSPFFYGYTGFENISDAEKHAIKEKWSKDAEYLIDKPYMDNLIDESSARRDDLLSWGLGGKPKKESSVQVIERTMVTDLMVQGGHAIGAIGFSMDRDEVVIIHANAVVMCSGSGAFKSPGYACCSLTHDGDAMAYRAGGKISGKEFGAGSAGVVDDFGDSDNLGASLGLEISFDIFSGGADRAAVRSAAAEQRAYENDLKITAKKEIRTALATVAAAMQTFELQEENTDLMETTRDLDDAGQASLVRMNEAQNNLVSSQGDLADARMSLRLAREELDYYTGRIISE